MAGAEISRHFPEVDFDVDSLVVNRLVEDKMSKAYLLRFLTRCALVVTLAVMGWYFVATVQEADPNFKAGIVGAVAVFVVAILTNFLTRKREIDARHFSEKREAYGKIVSLVVEIQSHDESEGTKLTKALLAKMIDFKKELMIWGSPEVIQSWLNLEAESKKDNKDATRIARVMEQILRAIRKDLGHDDRWLKQGSLLRLIVLAKDERIHLVNNK